MGKTLTKEETFIKFKNVHDNKYDYSKSVFIDRGTPIEIICTIHGSFFRTPKRHKCKTGGCPICSKEVWVKNQTKTKEQFEVNVFNLHGSSYSILGEYITGKKHIEIKHNTCGNIFRMRPNSFLRGQKCPKCQHRSYKKTTEEFKREVSELTNNEYALVSEYATAKQNITIQHNKCGTQFSLRPNSFLRQGTRCPECSTAVSKGELFFETFLKDQKIEYKKQVKFKTCKNKRELPFDFGLYKNNTLLCLVEIDGKQHFEQSDSIFKSAIAHDIIKNNYCEMYNIKLFRIPYVKGTCDIQKYFTNVLMLYQRK